MEPKDNIQTLPQPSKEEMEKQMADNVKKQKDEAKAIIDANDFCLVIAFKATDEVNDPIKFANMTITSSRQQLPLLPVLGASSEMLNEQFNAEINGLKKNFATNARTK